MAVCCPAGAGQIASWQCIRVGDSHFQWSQDEACLPPALPTASTTTTALFYMRLSPTAEQGLCFFSKSATFCHIAQLYTSSVRLFEAAISAVSVVKLPLDGLLLVIMLILAGKGRHSRVYQRLSS